MDRGHAEEAERAGERGLTAQPQIVAEARVDAVDRMPFSGLGVG
jgi:hypothetical protein